MKKFTLCIALAFVLVMGVSSTSLAGVTLDSSGSCNDVYLEVKSMGSGIYEAHGYEFGCGYNDRLATGSLRVAGGVAYFGNISSSGQSGSGTGQSLGSQNAAINLSSKTGSYYYLYTYVSGSAIAGHSGSGTYTMTIGGPQTETSGPLEADEALP